VRNTGKELLFSFFFFFCGVLGFFGGSGGEGGREGGRLKVKSNFPEIVGEGGREGGREGGPREEEEVGIGK